MEFSLLIKNKWKNNQEKHKLGKVCPLRVRKKAQQSRTLSRHYCETFGK